MDSRSVGPGTRAVTETESETESEPESARLTARRPVAYVVVMGLRGSQVLLLGATGRLGIRLCEAWLALGAEVVAADRLRTRLEALRASLGQHERLHVAEADILDLAGLAILLQDVSRDRPLDVLVVAVEAEVSGGALTAMLATALPHLRPEVGRVLIVTGPSGPSEEVLAEVVASAPPAVAVNALMGGEADGDLLERAAALADPAGPFVTGTVEHC